MFGVLLMLPVSTVNPMPSPEQFVSSVRGVVPALIWAAAIIAITYAGSRIASGRLRGALVRGGFQANVAILLARGLWLTIWIIGFLLVLTQVGTGLTPLTAVVGVLGLAASLSLQQVLQNLVAGIYLLAERPFQLGDFIAVVGPAGVNHEGRVEDIQMRTTQLRNRDNELILVPNSAIFAGVVTNRTEVGGFVRHVTVTFPRQTDVESIKQQLLPLLRTLPSVLPSPQPVLRVDKVGVDTWTACLSIWASNREAESDTVWALSQTFPDARVNDGADA